MHEPTSGPNPAERATQHPIPDNTVDCANPDAYRVPDCAAIPVAHRTDRDSRGTNLHGITAASRILAGTQRWRCGERRGVAGNLEPRHAAVHYSWLGNAAIPESRGRSRIHPLGGDDSHVRGKRTPRSNQSPSLR